MAKLIFRYGAMGSSKTANLLMVRYNYIDKGKTVILLKPDIEDRDGKRIIKSRVGIESECGYVSEFMKEVMENGSVKADAILIDEAQFLTANEVEFFAWVVDNLSITVVCYGLRTDFTGHLFEGSKRLMELAEVIEEIPTICWCGKKAHFNARIKDGKIVRDGDQIQLGKEESYIPLCRKHFMSGQIKPEE